MTPFQIVGMSIFLVVFSVYSTYRYYERVVIPRINRENWMFLEKKYVQGYQNGVAHMRRMKFSIDAPDHSHNGSKNREDRKI
jgi:hypothetical protein